MAPLFSKTEKTHSVFSVMFGFFSVLMGFAKCKITDEIRIETFKF